MRRAHTGAFVLMCLKHRRFLPAAQSDQRPHGGTVPGRGCSRRAGTCCTAPAQNGCCFAIDTEGETDLAKVMRMADQALYAAKHRGRNRVVRADVLADPIAA
jgi:GGDEF domain-containing protein